MAYEAEEVKISKEIFCTLISKHELREEDNKELFEGYTQNPRIMNLVKSQGEIADCTVERYGSVIYLIPAEDNDFLGFPKQELKAKLCKSGATDKDYYLSQFVILTMLTEFYDGQGSSSKSREYIKVGELINLVSDRLIQAGNNMTEEEEGKTGLAFSNMLEAYTALRSDEKGRKTKTTKEGFVHRILTFLQEQGLIEYIERDDMINTTKKLDSFMDWNLLNQNNYIRVSKVLGISDEKEKVKGE